MTAMPQLGVGAICGVSVSSLPNPQPRRRLASLAGRRRTSISGVDRLKSTRLNHLSRWR